MESTVADPQETQQNTACPKLRQPFITSSNAKAIGAAGAQARIAKQNAKKLELQRAKDRLELLQPIVEASIAQAATLPVGSDEEYRLFRLARTRQQLATLDDQIAKEKDPKCVKSLADAIGRLSDLEFALSGRSKPGLTRPTAKKPTKPDTLGPIE